MTAVSVMKEWREMAGGQPRLSVRPHYLTSLTSCGHRGTNFKRNSASVLLICEDDKLCHWTSADVFRHR